MSDLELFWATVAVPFETYRRGQRVRLPRTYRNASLAVSGYLIFDPILTEVLDPPATKVRGRRGTRTDQ